MAHGLPVITLRHHGAADLVPDEAGIKVQVTSPAETRQSIAAAIARLAASADLRATMGAAGHRRAQEFTLSSRMTEIEAVYESVASTKPSGQESCRETEHTVAHDVHAESRADEFSAPLQWGRGLRPLVVGLMRGRRVRRTLANLSQVTALARRHSPSPVGARERLRYLRDQPGFHSQPLRVTARCIAWELRRLGGLDATLRVHDDCAMRVTPPARGHGFDGLLYCFREFYEPGVRAALLAELEPGFVAYDIGANIGLWTLLMSRLVGPTGSVTAFEPVPTTAARLRVNLLLSGARSVNVEEVALGNAQGTARIFRPMDPGRASLAPESENDEMFEVQVKTLDAHWREAGAPTVNLLKIDAEGSEPRILEGANRLFAACRPVVLCEVNPAKLSPLGHQASDIHDFFAAHDYAPYVWDDSLRRFRESVDTNDDNVLFKPINDGSQC